MCIRDFKYIFSVDKVVPVDVLPVFSADTITMLFIYPDVFLWKPHISVLIPTIKYYCT